jgi:protein-S-isoprenylcysteine O-methyltransferase Ste14
MRERHFIDSHKVLTGPVVLAMIAAHGQWENPTAWVYLGLHGGYGLLWAAKSRIFPDRTWERAAGPARGLVLWGALTLYWIAPWLLTSRGASAPAWLLGAAALLFGAGVFLHFAADMQKWTALRLRPGSLVTEGLFARTRNPNYLGELLIYGSFALLARHWAPFAVLALFLAAVWIPNMVRKDRSLARYPEFAGWRRRTALLVPYIL